jgi:C4-dicarboxylate-binding protein DctP
VQKYLVVSEHGAMEDVVMFNPAWWNSLTDEYRTIITDTFNEVVPELRDHKAKAVEEALSAIKEGDINVRVASDEEKAALREMTYEKAKQAYIDRAGEAGEALIATYEKAYSELK